MTDRYTRQTVLPQVGSAGQARLARARVLVVGAGGLGCAVLPYLAAAGIGRMLMADPDVVEETNLHRQPLFRMADIGRSKVAAARAALVALNPQVEVEALEAARHPGQCGRAGGARRRGRGRRGQPRGHLRAQRCLPGRRHGAGECLGARPRRLRRRVLRARTELSRSLPRDAASGRLLCGSGRAGHGGRESSARCRRT